MATTEAAPAALSDEVLAKLEVLQAMPDDVRRLVIAGLVPASYRFGDVIVREGEEADAFYVVVSGKARAVKRRDDGDEVALTLLRPGDGFGEVALLEETTRSATVRASDDVEVLKLEKTAFAELVRENPEVKKHFARHLGRYRMRDFLRLYSPFAKLPEDTLDALIARLDRVSAGKDEALYEQGSTPAGLYLIEEGRVRVFMEGDERALDLAYLRKGDFCGERALLGPAEQTTSAKTLAPASLLLLPRDSFEELFERCPVFRAIVEERVQRYEYKRVARVPLDFAEEIVPEETALEEAAALLDVAEADAEGVDPAPAAARGRRRLRRRRFPHVWQVDEMDCGAACLAMVCRHFGRSVSLAHIRKLVHTSLDGTSLAGIVDGARSLGLEARSVRASKGRVADLALPAVVHVGGNHWVVLYALDDKHVRVADPARGLERLSREEFDERWTGYAALLAYGEGIEQAPEGESNAGWLIDFFRPFAGKLAKVFGLALLAAALQMVLPVFTKVVVDDVLPARDYDLLLILLFGFLGATVAITAASVIQRWLLSRVAVEIDGTSLNFLTDRMLALPMSYFHARRIGDIQRRLGGMRQLRQFVVQNGVRGLTSATTVSVAVTLMFIYDWLLALVFLATVPLYALLMRFSRRRLRPMFSSLEEAFGKYHSHQIDAIEGIETVKVMAAERAFARNLLDQFHAFRKTLLRADFTIMCYEAAIQLIGFVSVFLFLLIGSLRVLSGDLTVGELVSFNVLVLLANGPIVVLLSVWDDLQFGAVLINRLGDVVEQEPEQGFDHSGLVPVRSMEGAIAFKDLGFTYGGPTAKPILQGITLQVDPGTTVAIVGRSGSGKTTLVRCLSGLLEPTEGTITYDGLDMRKLDYRQLRRQIGYVLQENHLFDDTIARNIAFGADEVDMDSVRWAAQVANAHEFIERLPLGYDTRVGESGLQVSGGQRQRLSIARALYNKPPVLIFDEATSALDTESERAVQENMDQLFEGRTSFVIAHRLSTIRDADKIIVLEKGRIAEQGDHEQLMKRQGIYYYLCSQQLGI